MARILSVIIILFAFKESFILGSLVLAYVLWELREQKHWQMGATEAMKQQREQLEGELNKKEEKLKSVLDAVEEEELTIDKDFQEPKEMPQRFVNYNDFLINDYGGWYTVLYPDMKPYPKMFMNIVEAQKTIDKLRIDWQFEKPKKSTVQNIRFVR